ncbi:MAG: tetratricopeptide repeat-containing protein [Saprospiraceae bacterium]
MRKLMLGLLSLALFAFTAQAQEAEKDVKKAGRALSSFNLDPGNNQDKLKEAIDLIESAVKSPEMANNYDAWQQRGEIYNAACANQESKKALAELKGETFNYSNYDAPVKALESFKKSISLSEKKWQTKGALKSLRETVSYLNAYSNKKLQANKYAEAYPLLDGLLTARNLLIENGEDDIFTEPGTEKDHMYLVAVTANLAGENARAKELFKKLYEMKDTKPEVYANYYRILSEEGSDEAMTVLKEGREKFPDNSEILFAEINEYIKQEKFDALEASLKKAIEREPDNPSVYSALGNVYMNLMQQESEAGNPEQADKYQNQSVEYYEKALELDPNLFEAVYSIGSVYFNKAVGIVQQMTQLGISKEDQKKYEAMDKEAKMLFDKALPYFKKSEMMSPGDINTLIALKEIYARNSDFEKSNEFKKRLDKVQNGEELESYFKNN